MKTQNNFALTIITVCRNQASDIAETCLSVTSQSWQDFEWIVVDGDSDDGTIDILCNYKNRIDTLVLEPDTGVYNAMNKGIKQASGKWILFLNGGDRLYNSDVLSKIFAPSRFTEDILIGDELRELRGRITAYKTVPPERSIDKLFFAYDTISHQATFIKRELFERYGLYDETFKVCGDWEKWVVFAKHDCTFKNLDMLVSVFKRGGMSSQKKYGRLSSLERQKMRNRHYTLEEQNIAAELSGRYSGYRTIKKALTIAGFHLFMVEERFDRSKKLYRLFGIPVLKAKRTAYAKEKYYLFCFIPLLEHIRIEIVA